MTRQLESPASEQRRFARGRAWVLFSFVLAGLVLTSLGLAIPFLRRRAPGDMAQEPADEQTVQLAVPPIDNAAPAEGKTATFALG